MRVESEIVAAAVPVLVIESAPAPESVMVNVPVAAPKATAWLLAPKVSVTGVADVLSMKELPAEVAVSPLMVSLNPLRLRVAVAAAAGLRATLPAVAPSGITPLAPSLSVPEETVMLPALRTGLVPVRVRLPLPE